MTSPAPVRLTLSDVRSRRREILRIAAEAGAGNVRIFGSVARDEADATSDVDILVDITADVRGLAYYGLIEDLRRALREVLGREVDVADSATLRGMRTRVLREAVPI
jgi:hypothetical protein